MINYNVSGEFMSVTPKDLLNKNSFSTMENEHFRGGYITRYYGEEFDRCEAIQIELCYKTYIFDISFHDSDILPVKN